MQPEPRRIGIAIAALLFIGTSDAQAQLSYRLAPVGGRSELLGGTGMVFGRDASAAFLNPATAVLVDDQRLSFSVNFYKLTSTQSSNWYTPGPIDWSKFGNVDPKSAALTNLDFDTLPSSLCFFFLSSKLQFLESAKRDPSTKDAHIGLCFASVSDEQFNFSSEALNSVQSGGTTRQVQTISQRYSKFDAGPTYAVRLSNALSIGASVHASLVNDQSLLQASAVSYNTPESPITSSYYGASRGAAFSFEGTFGATLRFGKQTLGLSVRTPSLQVYGLGGVNRNTTYGGAAGDETSTLNASGNFVAHSPLRIGMGTGIEGAWGELEIDAFYFHQVGDSYHVNLTGNQTTTSGTSLSDQPITLDLSQRSKGVVDMGAGAEVFMSERISLLTGVFTDVSAAPAGSLRGTLFNYFGDRSNRFGASLGMGTHGTLGELMVGTQFQYGWGERLSINSYQLPPVIGTAADHTIQFMFIIAGSTSLRALKRVVEDVKEVVRDPSVQKPVLESAPKKP